MSELIGIAEWCLFVGSLGAVIVIAFDAARLALRRWCR